MTAFFSNGKSRLTEKSNRKQNQSGVHKQKSLTVAAVRLQLNMPGELGKFPTTRQLKIIARQYLY
jgi:hypothetical protein